MRTKRKLRPGDPGTKKYVKTYGNELVCVRYRYDEENQIRYTTVELIIETGPMKNRMVKESVITSGESVFIKISQDEDALEEQVKLFGGTWDENLKLWKLDPDTAKELNLSERVVN